MDNFEKLFRRCKFGVYVTQNKHKDLYQTVSKYLHDLNSCRPDPIDIDPVVRKEMETNNAVVELQFYPDSPVGFYEVYHWDISEALKQALDILGE